MPDSNNMIDLGKFKSYYDQLDNIQKVVDKLITKQNASVYDKIGTKTEILFNSISAIDLKSAPVEDIRTIIYLLKKLRDTCLTLSSYKQYLTSVISATTEVLNASVANQGMETEVVSPTDTINVNSAQQENAGSISLELSNVEGNAV